MPNYINYLNLGGFLSNCAITFGASPVLGFPNNAELSAKYQTIITPAGFAFIIWGVIFLFQGIFTIVQMIPKYSDLPMIQKGVSVWYFVVCIAQSAWTLLFGYEQIVASAVAMLCLLFALLVLLCRQTSFDVSDGSLFEFWLLRFPFEIHAGWIVAASAVNISVVSVFQGEEASTQLWFAVGGFLWVVIFAVIFTFVERDPNYSIPAVGAWATLAIAYELLEPSEQIENTFDASQIGNVRIASACLSGFLLLWCFGFGIRQGVNGRCYPTRSSEGERHLQKWLLHGREDDSTWGKDDLTLL